MRVFLKENIKNLISVAILLICTIALIGTKEALARILPNCETLRLIRCNVENEEYRYGYTGKEITPKIDRIVFMDADNNTIIKYDDEFSILSYKNNVEMGMADVEISVDGYNGSFIMEDVFKIQPNQAEGLRLTASDSGLIEVQWDEVYGVDGYVLYRSHDGVNYTQIKEIPVGDALIYQDTDMALNGVYTYKVCTFANVSGVRMDGFMSDSIHYNAPLARPVIKAVQNITFHSLQVQWNVVEGAVGYQVYRSMTEQGEYACIADIKSGTNTSFLDATCESAVYNYYYVIACQNIEGQEIWGSPSDIKAGRTTPNKVSLSGSGTETSVNLSWKQTTGAQGYEVYRSINGGGYELVASFEGEEQLNWSEESLEKHTNYTYRVRAFCDSNGQTIYGSYSKTYEKEAVIIFDYSGETGMDILLQYVGRPYIYGGTSPTKGWDCSYFVKWTYATHFGVELPRTTAEQVEYGIEVDKNDRTSWQPGDLIFYKEKGRVSHVAVYLGNGQMIHALNSKYDTLIQDVDYYEMWDTKNSFYCIKRILVEF